MLRLARRDVTKHRGRSVLVVLLIALPVMLVAAGGTFLATWDVSAKEKITREMGGAQALVSTQSNFSKFRQTPDAERLSQVMADGKPAPTDLLPGTRRDEPHTAEAIQRVTGGTVLEVGTTRVRVAVNDRRIRLETLHIDGRHKAYKGMASLDSGRWPTAPDEIVVTKAAISQGVPDHGVLQLSDGDRAPFTRRVVGTATTPNREGLIALPTEAMVSNFLIDRPTPVTWSEVQRLNDYGLTAISRSVLANPPTDVAVDGPVDDPRDASNRAATVLIISGIVLVTMLLAGPAFTTSGARHRRALGQLASNGATRPMLRRFVLAQGLVLGALSAVVGVLAGGVIGIVIVRIWQWREPTRVFGPLDLRWSYGVGLALVATLSALGAAFIPAVIASRVNLIAVLRGQVSRRRVRAGWPLLGAVLAGAGGVLMFGSVTALEMGSEWAVVASTFLLFGGAFMCLPWLLARVASLAARLPLPLRIAARDVGRQRSRSLSGVGAIMASVALMTALAVGGASDIRNDEIHYLPQTTLGTGTIGAAPDSLDEAAAIARKAAPGVTVDEVRAVAPTYDDLGTGKTLPAVAALAPGCTFVQATAVSEESRCTVLSSSPTRQVFATASADSIARELHLTAGQKRHLEAGAVVLAKPLVGKVSTAGRLTVASGTARYMEPGIRDARQLKSAALPVIAVPDGAMQLGFPIGPTQAMVTPETATRMGWPTTPAQLKLSAPGGISADSELRISERLPDGAGIIVERGAQSSSLRYIQVMAAVFGLIVLVATLIGTALTQAEGRPDQATLAAVGAGRRVRRLIAGGQAAVIGLVGSMIGVTIGLVPGIAITYPLTRNVLDGGALSEPTTVIPWLTIAAVVVGVPLLAAALAALATRGAPKLTHRAT